MLGTEMYTNPKTPSLKSHPLPALLGKLGWGIFVLLLIFLPFQSLTQKWLKLPYQFLWVDEFLIVMAFILFSFGLSYYGRIKKGAAAILFSLLFLVIIGVISALCNGNPLIISGGGIFNYVKNFLVIPIFCLFVIPKKEVVSLYKILHWLALFLCLVAILQEIAFFLGFSVEKMGVHFVDLRFGFMRTPSLLGHPNVFGLYALLFFILDFSLHRRLRGQNLLFLLGIILSGSRVSWVALCFAFLYLLIQKNKKIVVGIFALISAIVVILTPYLSTAKELTSETYFRRYTILKSLGIWEDHPFWGVGPGMYGGWITPSFFSPVFKKYQFALQWIETIKRHRTLDCFWFQNLAEIGLLGTLNFIILLIVLWRVARRETLLAKDPFRKGILSGFSVMPIVIAAYLFTNVLNVTAFLLTYSLLFGMVLGMKDENPTD